MVHMMDMGDHEKLSEEMASKDKTEKREWQMAYPRIE